MFAWMIQNMATILISAGLILIVAVIIAGMVRDKKKGKSSCGGGCASCPAGSCCAMNGTCHQTKPEACDLP